MGLDSIHQKNVVHRDLKPENILLQDENVKICDFGSSKFIYPGTKSTPYIVSRYYRAPELLLARDDYDNKIDIFGKYVYYLAAGCIMAELFTLTPIFPGKSEGIQIFEIIMVMGKPNAGYFEKFNLPQKIKDDFNSLDNFKPQDLGKIINKSNGYEKEFVRLAADLLNKMLNMDPDQRISAKAALEHKFFN